MLMEKLIASMTPEQRGKLSELKALLNQPAKSTPGTSTDA